MATLFTRLPFTFHIRTTTFIHKLNGRIDGGHAKQLALFCKLSFMQQISTVGLRNRFFRLMFIISLVRGTKDTYQFGLVMLRGSLYVLITNLSKLFWHFSPLSFRFLLIFFDIVQNFKHFSYLRLIYHWIKSWKPRYSLDREFCNESIELKSHCLTTWPVSRKNLCINHRVIVTKFNLVRKFISKLRFDGP